MENEHAEISLEGYDEITDEYEIRASRERYEEESRNLLELTKRREEAAKLLKMETKERVAGVIKLIGKIDEAIEHTEEIVELTYRIYQKRIEQWKRVTELMATTEIIKPLLLQHIAENNPEKYDEVEALLSDDQTSH